MRRWVASIAAALAAVAVVAPRRPCAGRPRPWSRYASIRRPSTRSASRSSSKPTTITTQPSRSASAGRVTATDADGPPLFRVRPETVSEPVRPQFAGSLFDLAPGTSYELELHAVDPDGLDEVRGVEAVTRQVPLAEPAHPRPIAVARSIAASSSLVSTVGSSGMGPTSEHAKRVAPNPCTDRARPAWRRSPTRSIVQPTRTGSIRESRRTKRKPGTKVAGAGQADAAAPVSLSRRLLSCCSSSVAAVADATARATGYFGCQSVLAQSRGAQGSGIAPARPGAWNGACTARPP
jgi:hypothetical protein